MRRPSQVLLAVALMACAISLLAQPKPDPCQQRLERIAKEMTRLWHDPAKGKAFREPKGKKELENFLKSEIKEPFTCPVLNAPYLLLPEELGKQWELPILLADPKPHPDRSRFGVIPFPERGGKELEKFIATSLPPTREVQRELQQRLAPLRQKAKAAECLSNLRNVGLALMMYVQDYDEFFPPMKVLAQTQKVLDPYLRNPSLFNCPVTKKPYQPNPYLHLKRLKDVSKPAETPAFYDAQSHPDGMRGVVFTDGHAKMLSSKEWQSLQKRHKLPTPK